MKPYLIISGTIFALIPLVHTWRVVAEWDHFKSNPGDFLSMVVLGAVGAALAVWAFRLLRPAGR